MRANQKYHPIPGAERGRMSGRLRQSRLTLLLVAAVVVNKPMTGSIIAQACAPLNNCNGGPNMGAAFIESMGEGFSMSASANAAIGTTGVRAFAMGNYSSAQAGAGWGEEIQVTSTSLPAGTPVMVHPTVATTSNLTQHGITTHNLYSYLIDMSSGTSIYVVAVNVPGVPDTTGNIHTATGSALILEGGSGAFVESLPDPENPDDASSVDEDAADTTHFYLDPMTPGVTLVSSSGHDFSTPSPTSVPEPGSLVLLAASAILVLLPNRIRHALRQSAGDTPGFRPPVASRAD